jgi:cell division protein FtsQ
MRRLAYRTRWAMRQPPPPRWRKPALYGAVAAVCVALLGASWHIAQGIGLTERARFAIHERMVAATDGMGMRIGDILVAGRQRTSAAEIYQILEPYYGQSTLSVDISAIQQRLQSLPWVREATVSRQLPDGLTARLAEHRPIALWVPSVRATSTSQSVSDGAVPEQLPQGPALVSDQGDIIRVGSVYPFRHLPILSGADAPAAAPELLRLIAGEPMLAGRVTGAERVDGRRWNVFIDGRIEIRLPETETASAWHRLARLHQEQRLLARAIDAVDLRLDDRIVVRLPDEVLNPDLDRPTASLESFLAWGQPT